MIVYGSSFSPFVRKLSVYGLEKGLTFDYAPGGLGRGGPDFDECSPFRKIPGFRDPGADDGKDFCISDSTAIIAYLEAKYPAPNLIPTDPIARARTVWFEEFSDTILFAMAQPIFFNRFVAKAMKLPANEDAAVSAETKDLPPLIDYLEQIAPESGFLVEERITLADIAVASPWVNLGHVGVTIDATRWPKAATYVAGILARPSFAALLPAEQAMVARVA